MFHRAILDAKSTRFHKTRIIPSKTSFKTDGTHVASGLHTLIGLVPRLQRGWRSMDCMASGVFVTHTVRLSVSVCLLLPVSLSCPRLHRLCVYRHANQTSLITVWVSVGPHLNGLNCTMITFGKLCLYKGGVGWQNLIKFLRR